MNQSVGDRVEAGDVMAVLSSRELAAARSDYLGAEARLELEQETLEREESLLEARVGTQRELLEARKAVRMEAIALNLAEQNLHALGQNQAEVDALSESSGILPAGLHLKPYYQQKDIVEASVATVTGALVTGIALVALVLLVFMSGLRRLRPSIVVALAIPFSVLLAFIAMYWFDLSANLMSLGGLAIANGTGTGSEVQRPLATVVIGGLVTSTILTLLVIPALYKWFAIRRTDNPQDSLV